MSEKQMKFPKLPPLTATKKEFDAFAKHMKEFAASLEYKSMVKFEKELGKILEILDEPKRKSRRSNSRKSTSTKSRTKTRSTKAK